MSQHTLNLGNSAYVVAGNTTLTERLPSGTGSVDGAGIPDLSTTRIESITRRTSRSARLSSPGAQPRKKT